MEKENIVFKDYSGKMKQTRQRTWIVINLARLQLGTTTGRRSSVPTNY